MNHIHFALKLFLKQLVSLSIQASPTINGLDNDALYCEQCGDHDDYLGSFTTFRDFWDLIKDKCDIKGRGGYSLQYVYPIIVSEFDLPDNVKYDNDYERDCGFCSNSDKEILTRIKKLIKECSNGLFGGCSKEN